MSIAEKPTWDLSPAPESTGHVQLKDRYGLFINGKFVESAGGEYFASVNPANEKKIADVTEATKADVNKAVKAARKGAGRHRIDGWREADS